MASKASKLSGCLGMVIVIVALVIAAPFLSRCGKARQERAETARVAALTPEQRAADAAAKAKKQAAEQAAKSLGLARLTCKQAVEKSLNDPGSAQWEDYAKFFAVETEPRIYRVQAQLRAKNAFGAYMQTVFECIVEQSPTDPESWRPVSVKQLVP